MTSSHDHAGRRYEWRNHAISRGEARQRFLDAIREHAPSVLDSLARDPFARLRAAWVPTPDSDPWHQLMALRWAKVEAAARTGDHSMAELHGAVRQWARRWHLDEPWLCDVAVRTLALWCLLPKPPKREERRWAPVVATLRQPLSDEQRAIGACAYDPLAESRGHAESRIMAEQQELPPEERMGRAEIRRRMNEIERLVVGDDLPGAVLASRAHGMAPTRQQREELGTLVRTPDRRRRGNDDRRWVRLVQYQVLGMTAVDIANSETKAGHQALDDAWLLDAVRQAASDVGLTLRSASKGGYPKGRPRKD